MRGKDEQQGSVFSYISAEERIPADHPLRAVRRTIEEVLRAMSKKFDAVYADSGRHSIAPERLLRALPDSAVGMKLTNPTSRRPDLIASICSMLAAG